MGGTSDKAFAESAIERTVGMEVAKTRLYACSTTIMKQVALIRPSITG
jgi:hypothetical protein